MSGPPETYVFGHSEQEMLAEIETNRSVIVGHSEIGAWSRV